MVGDWRGASRLAASAVASGWRVLHTPSADDLPETIDLLNALVGTSPERPQPEPVQKSVAPSITAALEFIESNHAEQITLADAAKAATYSRCHFSKVFKEQVGVGFIRYLTDTRLRHARDMLASSELQVTEIALAVGFGDLCHFERVFRRQHRQTPTQFRAAAQRKRRIA